MAKQSRPTAQVRRSPRAARPAAGRAPLLPTRPLLAPFAAVFGVLAAVEMGYLAWLLVDPDAGFDTVPVWPVAVLAGLGVVCVVGAVLVVLGRWRGWLVLAVGSTLSLLVLLAIAVLFGSLGAGSETWWAVVMTVGPLGALVLACRAPVRGWTSG
ncbi:hypothetical protein SAMN05660199_02495 [Klenkia soli]|uniref:Tryptophan-associated transmembrane protein (Trp_oprn_chp) n=1 Tax=Klenkia soli TaxID=1052260 RepID=A0A1H0M1T1_9ACTN|nr:hypothetical protein [Klenkia soli]SDO74251.1 hypothetical protein SAMN05660199_02495 [Klenkia soli]